MSKYAIKKQGKVVKAYQLGVGNPMETQLIQEGAIKVIGNGQYELFSQEAVNGHGEVAVAGDYFKVDDKNGRHYPYPNKKDWFESNHIHVSGDEYQQKPKPNMIWESTDKINKAVKWLLDNKKLVINKGDEQHFFNAVLWGSLLSAAKDAVLVFYGIIKTPNGDIDDVDFNFVARDIFTRDYDYCDKQGNVLHGQSEIYKGSMDYTARDMKDDYDKSKDSKINLTGPDGTSVKDVPTKSQKYKIVGRYMEGSRVSAYCLEDDNGKVEPYTREQTIYLVARGDVSNCKAQLGEKAVVLSGYPTPLRDLPVLDLKTMQTRNNDGMTKPTKSNPNKLGQWNIVALVVADNDKRMIGGYVIQSANGDKRTVSSDNCRQLIKDRQIGNARLNMYNGKALIRAKEGNFNDLPKIPVSQIKKNSRGAVK